MILDKKFRRKKIPSNKELGYVQIYNPLQKEISMNIYVGNLAHEVTEEDLRLAFESFGQVETAAIIKDKYSGESKGFGFVEMPL